MKSREWPTTGVIAAQATIFGALLAFVLALSVCPASASIVFSEDFSGATPGANNSLAGTQFSVSSGAVDIVGVLNGSFFTCVNNPSGNCLDLVGSPGLGAITTNPTFNLVPGDTYNISFGYILQGFPTGSTTPTSDFTVGLGSFSDQLTAIPTVQDASLSFSVGSNETGVNLTFAALTSPDNFHGPVLNDIVVTETSGSVVPEASTWAMMLLGFAGLGFAGLRTRKTNIGSPVAQARNGVGGVAARAGF